MVPAEVERAKTRVAQQVVKLQKAVKSQRAKLEKDRKSLEQQSGCKDQREHAAFEEQLNAQLGESVDSPIAVGASEVASKGCTYTAEFRKGKLESCFEKADTSQDGLLDLAELALVRCYVVADLLNVMVAGLWR